MKLPIIDGHMHITQWENANGESVFEALRHYQETNHIACVDNMCCTNNAHLWEYYEPDQNILGAVSKLENPTVFTHGCMYIPEHPDRSQRLQFKDQVEELMGIGFDGVKICDFKPDAYKLYRVEEHLEEYDEYIGYCEKYNVHMCWHIADPSAFWDPSKVSEKTKAKGWFYGDGTYPTYESLIDLAYTFLDHHPKLNLLLAHMFFKSFEPDEIVNLLEKYPNVCLDFSLGWGMFNGFRTHYEKWYRIFRQYSNRFLFATDAATHATPESLQNRAGYVLRFLKTDDEYFVRENCTTHGIRLEQEHLEKILYRNHERTVGKDPNPIDKAALKKHIERYLPLMPNTRNRALTEAYFRKNLL